VDLLDSLDKLMVEKWVVSDKSLWTINQLLYAGAWTAYQSLRNKSGKTTSYEGLEQALEKKQSKVAELRAVLGKLITELHRREKKLPLSNKQRRNVKLLMMQKQTNIQLKNRIEQQRAKLQIKTHQAKKLTARLAYKRKMFNINGSMLHV